MTKDETLFINKRGKRVYPDKDDPEWIEYMQDIAQTSLAVHQLWGDHSNESFKDYLGIVSIVINLFMLDTPEDRAKYMDNIVKTLSANKTTHDSSLT